MYQLLDSQTGAAELPNQALAEVSGGGYLQVWAIGVAVGITKNIFENWDEFKNEVRKHARD